MQMYSGEILFTNLLTHRALYANREFFKGLSSKQMNGSSWAFKESRTLFLRDTDRLMASQGALIC